MSTAFEKSKDVIIILRKNISWEQSVRIRLVERNMTTKDLAAAIGRERCQVSAAVNGSRTSEPIRRLIEKYFMESE